MNHTRKYCNISSMLFVAPHFTSLLARFTCCCVFPRETNTYFVTQKSLRTKNENEEKTAKQRFLSYNIF